MLCMLCMLVVLVVLVVCVVFVVSVVFLCGRVVFGPLEIFFLNFVKGYNRNIFFRRQKGVVLCKPKITKNR